MATVQRPSYASWEEFREYRSSIADLVARRRSVLILVRHGESVSNVLTRGWARLEPEDDVLTLRGRVQVMSTARWIAPLVSRALSASELVILGSTQRRARESAEMLAEAIGVFEVLSKVKGAQQTPIRWFDELVERYEGESFPALLDRVLPCISEHRTPGRIVLCVTHGHVIQAIVLWLLLGRQAQLVTEELAFRVETENGGMFLIEDDRVVWTNVFERNLVFQSELFPNLFLGSARREDINLVRDLTSWNEPLHRVDLAPQDNVHLDGGSPAEHAFDLREHPEWTQPLRTQGQVLFDAAVEQVVDLVTKGRENVYLHCRMGMNRSVAVLLAALARLEGGTIEEKLGQVRLFRQDISPDSTFMDFAQRHLSMLASTRAQA
jgi:broad specificity phosphatase PhoE